jgi:hypothetical protein
MDPKSEVAVVSILVVFAAMWLLLLIDSGLRRIAAKKRPRHRSWRWYHYRW